MSSELASMGQDQSVFFGQQPFNVQSARDQSEGTVTIPGSFEDQMGQPGRSFVDEAPNLAFDLPFGLGKLFHLPGERKES